MTLWLFVAGSHTCEFKYLHRLEAKSRGPLVCGCVCLTCLVGSYTWPLATETLQLQKKLYCFDVTLLACKPADRQKLVYWRAK